MNGYRKMISDRIPSVWDMTIRWCKCRKRFIEFVYDNIVRPYNNDVMHTKKERAKIISKLLKEELNPMSTSFREVVRLKKLLQYNQIIEFQYWKSVADWNDFFATRALYVKNSCQISRKTRGATTEELVKEVAENFGMDSKLAEYIIKSLDV